MPDLPSGTVTFLFTDIEGSTRLWERDSAAMWAAVERHFALLDTAISAQDGVLFKTVGDAVQVAFPSVPAAVSAAADAQRALASEVWGELSPLRVRMAIHAGDATPRNGDYLAPCLNRLSRVLSTGYGDQVLLTETARSLLGDRLPPDHDVRDLGAHRLKDLLVAERIYQLTGPGLPAEFPPLKSLDRQPHNLPAQPTALIGRDAEVSALLEMLTAPGSRLITLTGPGGIGKTRLALQAAAESLEEFPDGVWWVTLAAISDPDLVVPAIAAPLGVREVASEALLDTLAEHLRARQTLLLLDNLEQVIAAAPLVAHLLDAAPGLRVLATSRAPLRVRAEHEVPVEPLQLPALSTRGDSLAAAQASPAVQLFLDRAQAIKPGFALDESTAPAIAAICRRLDGLPLAIELAAARVRVLPPEQLLTRLDQRLKLLTGGSRDLPARQQTLRAAIAWSHDLLDADEQILFARLAVFAGGCTFEAAEAVCGASGDLALDILDSLDSLTQKSLLRSGDGTDGEPRFTMLETIREFGLERLEATDDAQTVRKAHADYFLALAETAEPQLTSSEQVPWLNRLGSEHDNFRSALGWLEQGAAGETRLRLAGALWRFWWMRGHLTEGRGWLERALADADDLPSAVQAQAFSGAGILAETQGDYEPAMALHERALQLWRQAGDQIGIASSLTNLGINQRIYGDSERAAELHEQALALWRELDDERGMSGSLNELGWLGLSRGDYERADDLFNQCLELARRSGEASATGTALESLGILAFYREDFPRAAMFYEQSLALWRALDDARMIGTTLANLGEVAHHRQDLNEANALYREALGIFRELGDKRGAAFALGQLGKVALAQGSTADATALFTESLELRQQVGDKAAILESLEGLASVAIAGGELERGVRIFGAAEALRQAIGTPLPASYVGEQERILASARGSLGDAKFKQEWIRGEQLSLDQAVAEAIVGDQLQVLTSFTAR